jgi:hypothetical protein
MGLLDNYSSEFAAQVVEHYKSNSAGHGLLRG